MFFDRGYQQNFIQEEIATKLKLKTLQENVAITINGFAGTKQSLTLLVEIPLTFADQTTIVKCICIKSIPANFKVHQIEDLIQANKLTLAFKPYYEPNFNRVQNVHCLIGSIDFQIKASWPQVVIGNSDSQTSVYWKINNEIIPIRPIKRFVKNLNFENAFQKTFHCPLPFEIVTNSNQVTLDRAILHLDFKSQVAEFEKESDFTDILNIAQYTELNNSCNQVLNFHPSIPIDEQLISEKDVTKFVLDNST